eukprot:907395_1
MAADHPRLTPEELWRMGLDQNTPHIKIEMTNNRRSIELSFRLWRCLNGGRIPGIFTQKTPSSNLVYRDVKDVDDQVSNSHNPFVTEMHRSKVRSANSLHAHLHRKIAITKTHLLIERGCKDLETLEYPWYVYNVESIPLEKIAALHTSRTGVLETLRIYTDNDNASYQPYREPDYIIYGISDAEAVARLIFATRRSAGIKTPSLHIPQQLIARQTYLLLSLIWVLLSFILASFIYSSPIYRYIVLNNIVLEMVLLCIAFATACLLFVILVCRFRRQHPNKDNPSRLLIKFGLLSLCLRRTVLAEILCIIIYIAYRFIIIVYGVHHLTICQYVDVLLHTFILFLFYVFCQIQTYQLFRYEINICYYLRWWIMIILIFIQVILFVLVSLTVVSIVFIVDDSELELDQIQILQIMIHGFAMAHAMYMISHEMRMRFTLAGTRRSAGNAFNYKLYDILHGVSRHYTLITICFGSSMISLFVWRLIPWFRYVECFIITWCLFLMHWHSYYLYTWICSACVCCGGELDKDSRQMVHFDALFIETENYESDDIVLEIDNAVSNEYALLSERKCETQPGQCVSIEIVIKALKYYEEISMEKDTKNAKAKLMEYAHYNRDLLDAHIHIIMKHNNEHDFEQINALLIDDEADECQMMNCLYLMRHNRNTGTEAKAEEKDDDDDDDDDDEEYAYYRDLLDAIHCYLYHSYDTGFRVKRNELMATKDSTEMQEEEKYNESYFDEAFSKLYNIIKEKQNKSVLNKHNDRFASSIKFNITTNDNQSYTFLDGLIEKIKKSKRISIDEIETIVLWLNTENYDSDSIKRDISRDIKSSNIARFSRLNSNNESIYALMQKYCYHVELYQRTFNIGLRFYYWPFYKTFKTNINDDNYWNKNQHGEYDICELYVEPKYESLKDEILQNKTRRLSPNAFRKAITKAKKLYATKQTKSMTVCQRPTHKDPLHYEIEANSEITQQHLLALTLYCDYDAISMEFSRSFRKTSPFQSIEAIIQNNREYCIWSRLLREAVEYFGCNGFGEIQEGELNYQRFTQRYITNELKGPFYCGLSFLINIPEFNIRLCQPTSTSRHIEVALKFAGKNGIVVELNNNGTEINGELRGFDCSWISRYPNESEVLFCGGEYRIRIESVVIIRTKDNYRQFFRALFYFDCMLNGSLLGGHHVKKITTSNNQTIKSLIHHKLEIQPNSYPNYINETFTAFTENKKEIFFNLHGIHMNLHALSALMLYSLTKTKIINPMKVRNRTRRVSIVGERKNMFKPLLFDLFPNANVITIYCKQLPFIEYELDLLILLPLIQSASIWDLKHAKISIKAMSPSWILSQFTPRIEEQYNLNDLLITKTKYTDHNGNKIDCLAIIPATKRLICR